MAEVAQGLTSSTVEGKKSEVIFFVRSAWNWRLQMKEGSMSSCTPCYVSMVSRCMNGWQRYAHFPGLTTDLQSVNNPSLLCQTFPRKIALCQRIKDKLDMTDPNTILLFLSIIADFFCIIIIIYIFFTSPFLVSCISRRIFYYYVIFRYSLIIPTEWV